MRVFVTSSIPDAGLALLRDNDITVHTLPNKSSKKWIMQELQKEAYDGMITLLTDTIDEEVLDVVGSSMKIIANYAVGFNNIAVEEAKKRNIVITNTPGVLTETVAEHTFALILAVATRVVESDSFVRAKKFTGWEPQLLLGIDLHEKTLGILGAGRIGTRVAEIGKAFGMRIIYYDLQKNDALEKKTDAAMYESPEEVLRNADVLSLHLPLNDATHHFLNEERLSLLRSNAIVVNTSRGPVIDEGALIAVLREKRIFGAGLDVFENEPTVPRALRALPNVILTPHTASASIRTRNKMAQIAAENVVAVLHGGQPLHAV